MDSNGWIIKTQSKVGIEWSMGLCIIWELTVQNTSGYTGGPKKKCMTIDV